MVNDKAKVFGKGEVALSLSEQLKSHRVAKYTQSHMIADGETARRKAEMLLWRIH